MVVGISTSLVLIHEGCLYKWIGQHSTVTATTANRDLYRWRFLCGCRKTNITKRQISVTSPNVRTWNSRTKAPKNYATVESTLNSNEITLWYQNPGNKSRPSYSNLAWRSPSGTVTLPCISVGYHSEWRTWYCTSTAPNVPISLSTVNCNFRLFPSTWIVWAPSWSLKTPWGLSLALKSQDWPRELNFNRDTWNRFHETDFKRENIIVFSYSG